MLLKKFKISLMILILLTGCTNKKGIEYSVIDDHLLIGNCPKIKLYSARNFEPMIVQETGNRNTCYFYDGFVYVIAFDTHNCQSRDSIRVPFSSTIKPALSYNKAGILEY